MMFRAQKKAQPESKVRSFQLRAQVDSEIEIRTETLLGREYTVVPVIAMVEGVRFGANADAPELGLASEFGADVVMWANRPLVLNHPSVEIDGEQVYCSANQPEILEAYCFGMTMNPYVDDGKLKMEAWVDVARVEELGGEFQEVMDAILAEEMVEVSVGFFSQLESKKGKFRGQSYSGIWRNIKPDHLAILSIGTLGACSNADGCGIPRINQKEADMADKNKTPALKVDRPQSGGCGCGGHDASSCQCNDHNEPHAHSHADEHPKQVTQTEQDELENHLAAEADRAEVRKFNAKIVAQAVDGTLTDNDVRKLISRALRTKFANCDCYLYGFTADKAIFEMYGHWPHGYSYMTFQIGVNVTEAGVEFVGEAEEVVLLTKIVPQSEAQSPTVQTKENDMADDPTKTTTATSAEQSQQQATQTTPAPAPVAQQTQQKAEPMTVQAYIANAPEEVREVLESSMKMHSDRKNACIAKIKAHKGNKFSDEALKAFKLDALEAMVALMGEEQPSPSYAGVAAPTPVTAQASADDSAVPAPPRLFAVKTAS
jgi:hypothetical protein